MSRHDRLGAPRHTAWCDVALRRRPRRGPRQNTGPREMRSSVGHPPPPRAGRRDPRQAERRRARAAGRQGAQHGERRAQGARLPPDAAVRADARPPRPGRRTCCGTGCAGGTPPPATRCSTPGGRRPSWPSATRVYRSCCSGTRWVGGPRSAPRERRTSPPCARWRRGWTGATRSPSWPGAQSSSPTATASASPIRPSPTRYAAARQVGGRRDLPVRPARRRPLHAHPASATGTGWCGGSCSG